MLGRCASSTYHFRESKTKNSQHSAGYLIGIFLIQYYDCCASWSRSLVKSAAVNSTSLPSSDTRILVLVLVLMATSSAERAARSIAAYEPAKSGSHLLEISVLLVTKKDLIDLAFEFWLHPSHTPFTNDVVNFTQLFNAESHLCSQ
jgi:hypothetical protein